MTKTNFPKNNPQGGNGSSNNQYAYKPAKIGAIIKNLMEQKRISKKTIASFMKVTVKTVENWWERAYLPMPIMLKLSEALDHNLLQHYHPAVKPLPNPLQETLDKARVDASELKELREKNTRFLGIIKGLEAQVEVLKEMVEKKNGR